MIAPLPMKLRFVQRQFNQEFENIYALEIGCFLTADILYNPRKV
ncbi:MAG: hypothetical protein WAL98_15845 [Desulfatiglandaceae bacterium]|jgi:hypothetical protein